MSRRGGFTLIEMLVVVLIIGIVSAGVVLAVSLTGRDSELEREATRLHTLLDYAREQAELQTRDYGVIFRDDGYDFVAFDQRRGVWSRVESDDALRTRQLPEGLDLRLVVDGRPVVLNRPRDAKDLTPQVIVYANDDFSSCEITIEREGGLRSISIALDDKGQLIEKPLVENHA